MSDYITIPLSQGKETIISIEDSDLANLKWCAARQTKTGRYYAVGKGKRDENGKQKTIYLHRMILERILGRNLERNEFSDHVDNDLSLDNRRSNLRLSRNSENQRNRGIPKNNSSGFKGVYWIKRKSKWQASITVNGENIHLGFYNKKEDAIEARRKATEKYHGEFGRFD